jgi:hypothetical protein
VSTIDVSKLLDDDIAEAFVDPLSPPDRKIMLLQVQQLRNQQRLLRQFEATSLAVELGEPQPKEGGDHVSS